MCLEPSTGREYAAMTMQFSRSEVQNHLAAMCLLFKDCPKG